VLKNRHPVPIKLPQKKNPPIVLWLASLKRLKQAELFIELAKACQDLNCRFILAGRCSDKGYLSELLMQMQGLSNIEYIGRVTFEESDELIGCASVCVNTSKYEGFPNTFVQAWMRKVPVVSLNVDPDDILVSEGIGFHSGNMENMVADVKNLINNKGLREEMGEKAQKYAFEHHTPEKNVKKIVKLFDS
jgi:glycosyltransferase involved in cell wall biosynthesis